MRTREKKDAVQNKQTASITTFPFDSYTLYLFRLGPLSPEIPTIHSTLYMHIAVRLMALCAANKILAAAALVE